MHLFAKAVQRCKGVRCGGDTARKKTRKTCPMRPFCPPLLSAADVHDLKISVRLPHCQTDNCVCLFSKFRPLWGLPAQGTNRVKCGVCSTSDPSRGWKKGGSKVWQVVWGVCVGRHISKHIAGSAAEKDGGWWWWGAAHLAVGNSGAPAQHASPEGKK
eukprot:TRINITY_DN16687_c0_g1_i1.p1 TRINITY_DN16687_c0_g1~~TRINITY_DN16687_c0_g1_i1.p1  ORF type:complete len:158 (+),score=2.13 TRINITY_DN16687_c0_g1_i1:71-544(+)